MNEPFGKRNRRQITKPERAKIHKQVRAARPSKARFYVLICAVLLVLAVGGYALAL